VLTDARFAFHDSFPFPSKISKSKSTRKSIEEQIRLGQVVRLEISTSELIELGGLGGLTNLLAHNSSVTQLHLLRVDNIHWACRSQLIAQLLLSNTSILQIRLSINIKIGAEGAKYLSEGIKLNSTLQEIYLGCNNIGDEGAKYLSEAIKLNSTLQKIYLGYNDIGDEGAKYLADGFKLNSTLQVIYLEGNYIGAEGAKYLAEAIRLNSTLQEIYLGYNDIGADLESQINERIKENILRKEMNHRICICAFNQAHMGSYRLRFDKMILRFVYYPIMGIVPLE
jgi:hypothetical protein